MSLLQPTYEVTRVIVTVSTGVCQPKQRPYELNLSGVKLVMQSVVKEPPTFRGDNSDTFSVHE